MVTLTVWLPLAAEAQELRGTVNAEAPTSTQAPDQTNAGTAETGTGDTDASAEPPEASGALPMEIVDEVPIPPLLEPELRLTRPRRIEDDPYAPLGLRAGAFILRPSFEQTIGHDSNPRNEPDGDGSFFTRSVGRLELQSDWIRHEFRGSIEGAYTAYEEVPDLNAPDFHADLALRLDARDDLEVDLALRGSMESEDPGDPELPEGVKGRPDITRFGGTIGTTWKPGAISIGAEFLADRNIYEDAELNNGTIVDNSDRTYTSYELRLRTGYELSAALEPFVEGSVNTRVHDREFDDLGIQRGSEGYGVALGARFEPSALLSMEGKIGYREQIPDDPTLSALDALTVDGSLVWRPSALTTVRLTATTDLNETTITDSSGSIVRTAVASVEHALRRNLLLSGSLEFQRTDYSGIDYTIDRTTAEIGLDYRLTRTVAIRASAAHKIYDTSIPGEDYAATIIEAGLKLSR